MTRTMVRPERLAYTPDEEAQRLCAQNSIAFLIGFILDQQIRIQQAFKSPLYLQQRLGHLDPHKIASMDPEELIAVFAEKPPLHRFPKSMAVRVRDCMAHICEEYDGDADRVWLEAKDTADLRKRIAAMPGFGKFKSNTVTAVLARQFQLDFPGWEEGLPPYGALAYVDSLEDLKDYQERKGQYKKAKRAESDE
jgi:uncharacterized HhH-GPD family protein